MREFIFPAIQTPEQRVANLSNQGDWGRRHFNATAELDGYKSAYTREWERLSRADMLALDDAASVTGMTPDAYREMARKGKAILVRTEEQGRELVPSWALLEGEVNTLVVDIAKMYAAHKAHNLSVTGFLSFMQNTTITLNFDFMNAHLRDTGAIKNNFTALAQSVDDYQDLKAMGMVMSLRDAVKLAKKGSDGEIAEFIQAEAGKVIHGPNAYYPSLTA